MMKLTWDDLLEVWDDPDLKIDPIEITHSICRERPSCGDNCTLNFQIEDGIIVNCSTASYGCVLSSSIAAHIVDKCRGLTLAAARELKFEFDFEIVRKRCAALPISTLTEFLNETSNFARREET